MIRIFAFTIITIFLLGTGTNVRADEVTYKNARFGTTITFPVRLFDHRMELPQNGDGVTFLSPDKEASLSVFGQNNALLLNVSEFAKNASQERQSGDKVTLVQAKENWVVVSGFREEKIFYERFEFGENDIIHAAILLYPANDREKYEAHLANIMATLDGPNN